MTPTERRRPVTRRRRLAHLGVGGVIIAAASVRLAEDPTPAEIPTAAPAVEVDVASSLPMVKLARPVPVEATRSHRRRPLSASSRQPVTVKQTPAPIVLPTSTGGIPSVWVALVGCEASGDWHTNTGNGFSGGPQFSPSTWLGEGGGAYAPQAWEATPLEQLVVARRVLAAQGVGAWPVCGPRVGLARGD